MAKHRCDVAGCTRNRSRWQRVCARCFAVLPRRTSLALISAYRSGDRTAWRALRKESGHQLADNLASETRRLLARAGRSGRTLPPVSSQQAFQNHQRLLGEQD
ncbi:hypothetical protein [Sphingobium sp.]|uniref:hypothetical protein n=1 Tax=Sphingobium sp. TaxID=1912891 RepID=UPI0028BD420F|nr:hypothetical protein [Sphingobium sp.]